MVYEPKVKYHEGDKSPPKISSGFFSWVSPLIHVKEGELLEKVGLDAVTFLRKCVNIRCLADHSRVLHRLFAPIALVIHGSCPCVLRGVGRS